MRACEKCVIPSPAEGEGTLNCKWARPIFSVAQSTIARSLVVGATRDDSRKDEERRYEHGYF
jgi:hypothetical protein